MKKWICAALLIIFGAVFVASTAVADSAPTDIEAMWARVQQAESYTFTTDLAQTQHPRAAYDTAGQTSHTRRSYMRGTAQPQAGTFELELWQGDGSVAQPGSGVAVRTDADGRTFARRGQEQWREVDNITDAFAPGGDPFTYVDALTEAEPMDAPQGMRAFRYEISGEELGLKQMELALRRLGKVPPRGVEARVPEIYKGVTGAGELLIGADGLPVQHRITLNFPATEERGRASTESITTFADFVFAEEQTGGGADISGVGWPSAAAVVRGVVHGLTAVAGLGGLVLFVQAARARSRTRRRGVQGGFAAVVIVTMLVGPLLEVEQARAFYTAVEEREAAQEARNAPSEMETTLSNLFTAEQGPAVPQSGEALQMIRADDGTDSDEDGVSNVQETLLGRNPYRAEQAAPQALTAGNDDDDGDGLTNYEETLLGTSSSRADADADGEKDGLDTDGDGISDYDEVTTPYTVTYRIYNNLTLAEELTHTVRYANPAVADSNMDGVPDDLEWGKDTDGDGEPDLFDRDNDGDGVPDQSDISPFSGQNHTYTKANPLRIETAFQYRDARFGLLGANNQYSPRTVLTEFQITPTNPQHLWYAFNVFDWPYDAKGHIRDTNETTFADVLGFPNEAPYTHGDMQFVPMLEITMPSADRGMSVGKDVYDKYGIITLDEGWRAGTPITLYAPLSVVSDPVSGDRVAFQTKVPLNSGMTDAGLETRLVYALRGLTDKVDEDGNVIGDDLTIHHIYYSDFNLTGLQMRQDFGVDVAFAYEDPTADPDLGREDALYSLAYIMDETLLSGRDCERYLEHFRFRCVGDGELDVTVDTMPGMFDRIANAGTTAADRYGLEDGENYLRIKTKTYRDLDQAMMGIATADTQALVLDEFTSAATVTDVVPTVMYLRQERFRMFNLDQAGTAGEEAVTVRGDGSLSVAPPSNRGITLNVGGTWKPFAYNGSTWEAVPIADYWEELADRWQSDLSDVSDDKLKSGYMDLGRLYYLSYYQGVGDTLSVQGGFPFHYKHMLTPLEEGAIESGLRKLGAPAVKWIVNKLYLKINAKNLTLESFIREFADLTDNRVVSKLSEITYDDVDIGPGPGKIKNWVKTLFGTSKDISWTSRLKAAGGLLAVMVVMAIVAVGVTLIMLSFIPAIGELGRKILKAVGGVLLAAIMLIFTVIIPIINLVRTASKMISAGVAVTAVLAFAVVGSATSIGSSIFAAVVGFVVSVAIIWGLFVYNVLKHDIDPGSVQFDILLAMTIAATIYAAVSTALSFTIAGALLLAVIGVIDLLLWAFSVDFSISGAILDQITLNLQSANTTIATGASDLIDFGRLQFDFADVSRGFSTGNQLVLRMPYTATVRHDLEQVLANRPSSCNTFTKDNKFCSSLQLINNADDVYTSGNIRSHVVRPRFTYPGHQPADNFGHMSAMYGEWEVNTRTYIHYNGKTIPQYEAQVVDSYSTGEIPMPDTPSLGWQPVTSPDGVGGLRNELQNEIYLNVPITSCWIPIVGDGDCDAESNELVIRRHVDLSFDIFPATIDDFFALRTADGGGYSLDWHAKPLEGGLELDGPVLYDADGDGLISSHYGGSDWNDNDWDWDDDGLSDMAEYRLSTSISVAPASADNNLVDSDNDKLTDLAEMEAGTDPYKADSDGDGLDDLTELMGWAFTYAPGRTIRVFSSPMLADTDFDGIPDPQDRYEGTDVPDYPVGPHVVNDPYLEIAVWAEYDNLHPPGATFPVTFTFGSLSNNNFPSAGTAELDDGETAVQPLSFNIDGPTDVYTVVRTVTAADDPGVRNGDGTIHPAHWYDSFRVDGEAELQVSAGELTRWQTTESTALPTAVDGADPTPLYGWSSPYGMAAVESGRIAFRPISDTVGTATLLDDGTGTPADPALGCNTIDYCLAAWEEGGDIQAAVVGADGSVTPTTIAATAAAESDPAVISSGGVFLVVWTADGNLLARHVAAGGSADPIRTLDDGGNNAHPAVVWDGTAYQLVWEKQTAADTVHLYHTALSTGLTMDPAVKITTGSAVLHTAPDLATDGQKTAVIWLQGNDVYLRALSDPNVPATRLNDGNNSTPHIAYDGLNAAWLTGWSDGGDMVWQSVSTDQLPQGPVGESTGAVTGLACAPGEPCLAVDADEEQLEQPQLITVVPPCCNYDWFDQYFWYRVDYKAPDLTVQLPFTYVRRYHPGTTFIVHGTATDAFAGVEKVEVQVRDFGGTPVTGWETANGAGSWQYAVTAPAANGAYELAVRATDRMGYSTIVETGGNIGYFTVDGTAPTLTSAFGWPSLPIDFGNWLTETTFIVPLSVVEPETSNSRIDKIEVQVPRVNQSWQQLERQDPDCLYNCDWQVEVSLPIDAQGLYTVTGRARDEAGNQSAPVEAYRYRVDGRNPTVDTAVPTRLVNVDGQPVAQPVRFLNTDTITGTTADVGSGLQAVEVRLRTAEAMDETGWDAAALGPISTAVGTHEIMTQTAAWSYSLPDNVEGLYQFEARARDNTGRLSLVDQWRGTIDRVPPRLSFDMDYYGRGHAAYTTFTFQAEDYALNPDTIGDGGICPAGSTTITRNDDPFWQTWSSDTRPVTRVQVECTVSGHATNLQTLRACDQVGQCTTLNGRVYNPPAEPYGVVWHDGDIFRSYNFDTTAVSIISPTFPVTRTWLGEAYTTTADAPLTSFVIGPQGTLYWATEQQNGIGERQPAVLRYETDGTTAVHALPFNLNQTGPIDLSIDGPAEQLFWAQSGQVSSGDQHLIGLYTPQDDWWLARFYESGDGELTFYQDGRRFMVDRDTQNGNLATAATSGMSVWLGGTWRSGPEILIVEDVDASSTHVYYTTGSNQVRRAPFSDCYCHNSRLLFDAASHSWGPNPFDPGPLLVEDASDKLYFLDRGNGRLWRADGDGGALELMGDGLTDAHEIGFLRNLPPRAGTQSADTAYNTPVTVTLDAFDPAGEPLTYTLSQTPTHGTLSGWPTTATAAGPQLVYTPTNFSGVDTVRYTVTDPAGLEAVGSVLLNVAEFVPPTYLQTAVQSPQDGVYLDSVDPITITVGAESYPGLATADLFMAGVPIATQNWTVTDNITTAVWATSWTPTEGIHTITATLSNHDAAVAATQPVTITVDASDPTLTFPAQTFTSTHAAAFNGNVVSLSGSAADSGGLRRVEMQIGLETRTVAESSGTWRSDWRLDDLDGGVYTLSLRAEDWVGRAVTLTRPITADLQPPQAVTMTVTADGTPITAHETYTAGLPILAVNWTPTADGGGLPAQPYRVGWSNSPTPTVALNAYASPTAVTTSTQEGGVYYAHLQTEDRYGNTRLQTAGPFFIDMPYTPDRLRWSWSPHPSHHLMRDLDRDQDFYLTWSDEALRMRWTGANWSADGDLFIYARDAATASLETDTAYNPFGDGRVITMPWNVEAGYVIHVSETTTATLHQWDGGAWQLIRPLTADEWRYTDRVTDFRLPYSLFNNSMHQFGIVALATENDSLRTWSSAPLDNPHTADLVVDQPTMALRNGYFFYDTDNVLVHTEQTPQLSAVVRADRPTARISLANSGYEGVLDRYSRLDANLDGAIDTTGLPLATSAVVGRNQMISVTTTVVNNGPAPALDVRVDLAHYWDTGTASERHTVDIAQIGPGDTHTVTLTTTRPNEAAATELRLELTSDTVSYLHEVQWLHYRVDNTAPTSITLSAPPVGRQDDLVLITGRAADAAGLGAVTLFAGPVGNYTPVTCPVVGETAFRCEWTPTAGGNHYLYADVTDALGNQTTGGGRDYFVDQTAPVVQFASWESEYAYDIGFGAYLIDPRPSLPIYGSDNFGVQQMEACLGDVCDSVDVGGANNFLWNFEPQMPSGNAVSHTLSLTVTDMVGRQHTRSDYLFAVDDVGPSLSLFKQYTGTWPLDCFYDERIGTCGSINEFYLPLRGTAVDPGGMDRVIGIATDQNGATYSRAINNGGPSMNFSFTPDLRHAGTHTLTFKGEDAIGNIGVMAPFTITAGPGADLVLTSTQSAPDVVYGERVTTTLYLTNNTHRDLFFVSIPYTYTAAATLVNAPSGNFNGRSWDCNTDGCTLYRIYAGEQFAFELGWQTPTAGQAFTLTGTADYDHAPYDLVDVTPTDNLLTTTIPLHGPVDAAVSAAVTPTLPTAGSPLTYTLVVTGNEAWMIDDAQLTASIPAVLSGTTWSCTGTVGADCTPGTGSGAVNALVDVPIGGAITVTVGGTLPYTAAAQPISLTAGLAWPDDINAANNTAVVTTPVAAYPYTVTYQLDTDHEYPPLPNQLASEYYADTDYNVAVGEMVTITAVAELGRGAVDGVEIDVRVPWFGRMLPLTAEVVSWGPGIQSAALQPGDSGFLQDNLWNEMPVGGFFSFGSVKAVGANPADNRLVVRVTAVVLNHYDLENAAENVNSSMSSHVYVRLGDGRSTNQRYRLGIVEPDLAMSTHVGAADAGRSFPVRLGITHGISSTAPAHDLTVVQTLPAEMTYLPDSVQMTAEQAFGVGLVSAVQAGRTLSVTVGPALALSDRFTITYRLLTPLTGTHTLTPTLRWSSQPGDHPYERTGRQTMDWSAVNDYRVTGNAPLTVTLDPAHMLTVVAAETENRLRWANAPTFCGYEIHGGDAPHFTPTAATEMSTVTAGTDVYSLAGEPAGTRFYKLVVQVCGGGTAETNEVGVIPFTIAPGD